MGRAQVMHKIHNSGIIIFGVIPLCHIFGPEDNSCSDDTIEMKVSIYANLQKMQNGYEIKAPY